LRKALKTAVAKQSEPKVKIQGGNEEEDIKIDLNLE
jgi:hypothetical protein